MSDGRWYDKYPALGEYITKLKNVEEGKRARLLTGIKSLIEEFDPELVDRHVMEFPMSIKKRRWYDQDPYAWLAINTLKFADERVWDRVVDYLRGNLE